MSSSHNLVVQGRDCISVAVVVRNVAVVWVSTLLAGLVPLAKTSRSSRGGVKETVRASYR